MRNHSFRHRNADSHSSLWLVVLVVLAWLGGVERHALASPTISLKSTSSGANSFAKTLVINVPSGVAGGDLMVAGVASVGGTNITITPPAGWTSIRNDNGGTVIAQAAYYRIAGSSEPASYTWSISKTERAAGGIAAYTGADPTTPIDTSSGQGSSGNSNTLTAPTLTTATTNEMLLGLFSTAQNQSITPPSGMTSRWNLASGTAIQTEGADAIQVAAGASGSESATVGTSNAWAAELIAIQPACGGGSLSLAAPSSIGFGSSALNGSDQSVSAIPVLTPSDTTASGSGWNISGTSTTFTNGSGNTLPTTAATLTGASASTATGNCSLPVNSIAYPLTLPAGSTPPTAIKIFNASSNSGAGSSNVSLTFQLAIPASAYSGSYSSTWTFTIASGP